MLLKTKPMKTKQQQKNSTKPTLSQAHANLTVTDWKCLFFVLHYVTHKYLNIQKNGSKSSLAYKLETYVEAGFFLL